MLLQLYWLLLRNCLKPDHTDQKCNSFNENYGAPYILIANLYAMSPNWSDESALNKCTYFAVIDKLQRAKAVDPSVAEEANKLIGTYSGHTPQAKDLFMLGYKQGDRITIGAGSERLQRLDKIYVAKTK